MEGIRYDLEEQRLCMPDTLAFMLGRDQTNLIKRLLKTARDHGLAELLALLQRPSTHAFKARESNSRTKSLPYIESPAELVSVTIELLQHYIATNKSGAGGRQQALLPAFSRNLTEFHSNFNLCFEGLWTMSHCATQNQIPLHMNAEVQYARLLTSINSTTTKVMTLK